MPAMPSNDITSNPQQQIFSNPIHPTVVDKLDPIFVKLYNGYIASHPPAPLDLVTIRQQYSTRYAFATAPATGVGGIGETQIPGWSKYPGSVNVRVYVPPGEDPGERRIWPVHFNFHGGGWAAGDLESSAHLCHHICASVPCCVVDIEYRLIPEYPFPIGIMDSLAAVTHILISHNTFSIDPSRVTLGGESAGASIALILNHLLRDAGHTDKIKGIVVGTPNLSNLGKCVTAGQSQWASMLEAEHAPLLNWQRLKWFDTFKWLSLATSTEQLKNGDKNVRGLDAREKRQAVSWFANPLDAPDFSNLAPLTWIGTAEIDPLRDEAEAYGRKCEADGNKVILKRFKGVPHSFIHMDKLLPQAREYVQDVIKHIQMSLYPLDMPPEVSEISTVEGIGNVSSE